MHRTAEYGIAAHWKYKEGRTDVGQDAEEIKLSWLRQILEWQRDMSDNKEFMDTVKTDLDVFNENVYCFSPDGKVISLPEGSTPVDFAYAIHSAIGNTMISARVNGKIVTIDCKLQNGDRVEILTSQNSKGPSRDWLKFVKSSQARSKINQWYKKVNKEENIVKGREMLEREAKKKGYEITQLAVQESMDAVMNRYSFRDWDSVCAAVGHGGLKEGQVINRLVELYQAEQKRHKSADELIKEREEAIKAQMDTVVAAHPVKRGNGGVYVAGIGDTEVRLSRCCTPVPGDEIVGFITRGRGVSIHRTDCVNIINLSEEERSRLIEVEWNNGVDKPSGRYGAEIRVFAGDRNGLTMEILKVLMDEGVSVSNISARTGKSNDAVVDLSIMITGKEQLATVCKKISAVTGVESIERVTT
jgi:GTP pyrophosphokinase